VQHTVPHRNIDGQKNALAVIWVTKEKKKERKEERKKDTVYADQLDKYFVT